MVLPAGGAAEVLAWAWCRPAMALRGSRGVEEVLRPKSSGADEAKVELQRHGACKHGGGVAPEGLPWMWCPNVAPCTCNMGFGCFRRKPFTAFLPMG